VGSGEASQFLAVSLIAPQIADSVPGSAEVISLFDGKISLFAKLGKYRGKPLIRRAARRAVREPLQAICRFRCIPAGI
jgi:hypothetical protein